MESHIRIVRHFDADVLERRRALRYLEFLGGCDAFDQTIKFAREEVRRNPELMTIESMMLLIGKRWEELTKRVDSQTLEVAQDHLEKFPLLDSEAKAS